uniref:Uncharacterized protein n=1 Tax=Leersia perrieri TaxID=77586 RepID=A0A0D9V6R6_9ORYZ
MASANDGAPMSSLLLLPENPTGEPSSPPRRKAGNGVKCTSLCMCLPRLWKKKKRPVQPRTLGATSAYKAAEESPSARPVSSWWPSSLPRAASAGSAGRASPSQLRDALGSFSHWSRSSQVSRVTPHGAASVPFSFPSSPASGSSGTSTPKLAQPTTGADARSP